MAYPSPKLGLLAARTAPYRSNRSTFLLGADGIGAALRRRANGSARYVAGLGAVLMEAHCVAEVDPLVQAVRSSGKFQLIAG